MEYYRVKGLFLRWHIMENKNKILLVEDDPIIRHIHRTFLEKMEFQVDVSVTGTQALKMYESGFYHLVILDGGLPDMSGLELAKKIRKLEKENKLPRKSILLLSAYSSELLKSWCKEAEIDSFLVKPVDYEDLSLILESYFSQGNFCKKKA